MSAREVAPGWRMSLDPNEPLFPDTPPGRGYCSCVELEDGRPVGFVPDVDCPDHGECHPDALPLRVEREPRGETR